MFRILLPLPLLHSREVTQSVFDCQRLGQTRFREETRLRCAVRDRMRRRRQDGRRQVTNSDQDETRPRLGNTEPGCIQDPRNNAVAERGELPMQNLDDSATEHRDDSYDVLEDYCARLEKADHREKVENKFILRVRRQPRSGKAEPLARGTSRHDIDLTRPDVGSIRQILDADLSDVRSKRGYIRVIERVCLQRLFVEICGEERLETSPREPFAQSTGTAEEIDTGQGHATTSTIGGKYHSG